MRAAIRLLGFAAVFMGDATERRPQNPVHTRHALPRVLVCKSRYKLKYNAIAAGNGHLK
jgi:hypothetical protein